MSFKLKVTRHLARRLTRYAKPTNRSSNSSVVGQPRLLVVGIYLANAPNHVIPLVEEFARARRVVVEQRWICIKGAPPNSAVTQVTRGFRQEFVPKWQLVNELIGPHDLDRFDYFAVCDDDILVGDGFIDQFIAEQQALDFALAQPARTWRSFTDHEIVRRRLFTRARQTMFVESGPCVVFRNDFFRLAYPFSLESPMGWGYDLTWPILARDHGLKIGIIDGVPVDHSLRPRSALYDWKKELAVMSRYLSTREHVRQPQSSRSLQIYR